MGSPKESWISMEPYDTKVCSHPGCGWRPPDDAYSGHVTNTQSVANHVLQHKMEVHGELIPCVNKDLQDNNGEN